MVRFNEQTTAQADGFVFFAFSKLNAVIAKRSQIIREADDDCFVAHVECKNIKRHKCRLDTHTTTQ